MSKGEDHVDQRHADLHEPEQRTSRQRGWSAPRRPAPAAAARRNKRWMTRAAPNPPSLYSATGSHRRQVAQRRIALLVLSAPGVALIIGRAVSPVVGFRRGKMSMLQW